MNLPDKRHPELDDGRLIAALDEYAAALEGGRKPDRGAFLARHAEVAEALQECLDGMEALHEASASSVGASRPGAAPADWHPGASLGDFRLVREVGRGGMGVVYEAEQISLGRRIALKVLPFALTLDPRQLQRFKNEARAAAQLHHQHIVPVYYVGSERGVHFYAMQYIEGQSLADVIRALRQLAGKEGEAVPSPGAGQHEESTGSYHPPPHPQPLSPEAGERGDSRLPSPPLRGRGVGGEGARAETTSEPVSALATAYSAGGRGFYRSVARLGVQAAEALEHAHEYGVVHRDIKPANLLVDAHGHLWITDFGLAQFQTDVGLTQSGDLLGTLRYMSPEQAGGRRVALDHRTDVYSLGATLYELLTLRPPFDGGDRQTLLRQILHDEPLLPRALRPTIPIELETIVLKALAKVPAERYATARELADDLSRFLHDQPIRARRPSLLERATKWARRHRALVSSALAALLLIAAGLGVATLLTARAYDGERRKAREADEQRARADEQRARAEENFRRALQAVNQLVRIGEEELADRPDLDGLRWRLLETTLIYFQDFIDQHRDDPTISQELESGRAKVQTILGELSTLIASHQYIPLDFKPVQDELGLSREQRDSIHRIEQAWREEFWQSFSRPPAERERRRLALARNQEAQVAQILTPQQHRRFRQIALQFLGPHAFSDLEVIAALALTPGQKQQIREIQEAVKPGPRFGPLHKPFTLFNDARKQALKQIVDLLEPEQKRKWDELLGEPFAYDLHHCLPRRHSPEGKPNTRSRPPLGADDSPSPPASPRLRGATR